MNERQNDSQKQTKAGTAAALRLVVAGYLVYLGYKIAVNENTSMSPVTAKILCAAFIAAALAFGVYTLLRWRKDMAAAQITEPEAEPAEEQTE